MAKLVFLLDDRVVKEYVLNKERITIGRRASNDIHIDNLGISGQHAVVVTALDGTYIEDLNSTNGTIVNKVKVKKHMLADEDWVLLGKYKLRYLEDDTIVKPSNNGFESTVSVNDATLVQSQPAAEVMEVMEVQEAPVGDFEMDSTASVAEAPPKLPPRLTILNGEDVGATMLLDKSIVKLGQPSNQLALVTKRKQGYFISHVVGDGAVLVNGQAIDAHAHALDNHDEIEMLGVKMEFHLD